MAIVEQKRVWGDGGPRDGLLIYSNDALAAVVTRLDAEDAAEHYEAGRWFIEAGFGDCGILKHAKPASFASIEDVLAWVDAQMADHKPDQAAPD